MAPEFCQFYAKLDIPTNLEKLLTPMFFGIVGIHENSAFHSVEKPMILKKISGFEGEKRGFCVFLAFRPIFGGKNGDF